jgi:hypothetical protein
MSITRIKLASRVGTWQRTTVAATTITRRHPNVSPLKSRDSTNGASVSIAERLVTELEVVAINVWHEKTYDGGSPPEVAVKVNRHSIEDDCTKWGQERSGQSESGDPTEKIFGKRSNVAVDGSKWGQEKPHICYGKRCYGKCCYGKRCYGKCCYGKRLRARDVGKVLNAPIDNVDAQSMESGSDGKVSRTPIDRVNTGKVSLTPIDGMSSGKVLAVPIDSVNTGKVSPTPTDGINARTALAVSDGSTENEKQNARKVPSAPTDSVIERKTSAREIENVSVDDASTDKRNVVKVQTAPIADVYDESVIKVSSTPIANARVSKQSIGTA